VRIDNFYTATVYQKGAEVVRMIRTLIGTDAFRRGMELYFARHDGQAVTCDDFVAAMAAASGVDLPQFMRWYDQAGTPRLHVSGRYDGAARRYVLTVSQAVPGRPENQPYYIPIAVGLIGPDGTELLGGPDGRTRVLSLTEPTRDFIFENVAAPPTPSLLRGFSAPVILDYPYADADLTHLMAHDSDAFNRWEAAQELAGRLILAATGDYGAGRNPQWPPGFAEAAERVLSGADADPVFAAEVLIPPSEATLAERMAVVDPEALHAARNGLRRFLAERLREAFEACYRRHAPAGPYRFDIRSAARRTLRNLCLSYLMETDEAPVRALAMRQFTAADNMTDQFAALSALAQSEGRERVEAIESFYERWRHEPLVLNKWFSVQATSRRPATVDEVRRLIDHPAFDIRNPNKVYSLLGGFAANHVRFHAADGEGYRLLAEQILRLDALNPQVAARLARAFDRWRRFDGGRQAHARGALERMRNHAGLSRDVMEIVERALAGVA
jgi:aminopeptidase N